MNILTKEEFFAHEKEYIKKIEKGAIFIYPTDTIYGIGTNALDTKAVQKIREIKKRPDMPFSIIAPSKAWIHDNCEVRPYEQEWLDKMPGPYTLLLKLKNTNAISEEVNVSGQTVGVRIPDHWIAKIASDANMPIVTTSVNISGNAPLRHISEMQPDIGKYVQFCIDEGLLQGRPSKIIDCTSGTCAVRER